MPSIRIRNKLRKKPRVSTGLGFEHYVQNMQDAINRTRYILIGLAIVCALAFGNYIKDTWGWYKVRIEYSDYAVKDVSEKIKNHENVLEECPESHPTLLSCGCYYSCPEPQKTEKFHSPCGLHQNADYHAVNAWCKTNLKDPKVNWNENLKKESYRNSLKYKCKLLTERYAVLEKNNLNRFQDMPKAQLWLEGSTFSLFDLSLIISLLFTVFMSLCFFTVQQTRRFAEVLVMNFPVEADRKFVDAFMPNFLFLKTIPGQKQENDIIRLQPGVLIFVLPLFTVVFGVAYETMDIM